MGQVTLVIRDRENGVGLNSFMDFTGDEQRHSPAIRYGRLLRRIFNLCVCQSEQSFTAFEEGVVSFISEWNATNMDAYGQLTENARRARGLDTTGDDTDEEDEQLNIAGTDDTGDGADFGLGVADSGSDGSVVDVEAHPNDVTTEGVASEERTALLGNATPASDTQVGDVATTEPPFKVMSLQYIRCIEGRYYSGYLQPQTGEHRLIDNITGEKVEVIPFTADDYDQVFTAVRDAQQSW